MTSSRFSYAQNALRSTTIPSTVSPWLLQSHHSQIIINILPTSSNLMIHWTLTDARSNYTLSTVYNNHYHRYRITHLLSVITSHPTATQRLFWDDTLWRSGVAGKVQGQVTYGELYRAYKSRLYNCIKRTIHLWSVAWNKSYTVYEFCWKWKVWRRTVCLNLQHQCTVQSSQLNCMWVTRIYPPHK